MAPGEARVSPLAPLVRPAVAMLARSPDAPGKTRLTSHLAHAAAVDLRRALLLDSIAAALAPGWPLHLFVTPEGGVLTVRELVAHDAALAAHAGQCLLHEQGKGDLGARMHEALQRTLDAGHDAAVLVGSDLPALTADAITGAVTALAMAGGERRVVFGPARDGGFYLVAVRRAWPEPFAAAQWSHGAVLTETEARAQRARLDVIRVATCDDIDTVADLERLLASAAPSVAPRTRAWAATR